MDITSICLLYNFRIYLRIACLEFKFSVRKSHILCKRNINVVSIIYHSKSSDKYFLICEMYGKMGTTTTVNFS